MKIALAQLNYHIGNFQYNTDKIIEVLKKQKLLGTHLVVFSELSVCGYPPRDFLEYKAFVDVCEISAQKIASETYGIACIIGLPIKNTKPNGKNLFNAAYFIENGKVNATVKKALLPNYDIFDEYRYFEPSREFSCINFMGYKIALTICEDLWNFGNNPLYSICPMDELIKEQPDLMINIAASPFNYNQDKLRMEVLQQNCCKYNLPLFYVNHVGAQTELIFDGGSTVINREGSVIAKFNYFEEQVETFDFEKMEVGFKSEVFEEPADIEQIYQALVLGIRDYFRKSGFSKATLGLSGGIDSALVCALAVDALGAENVMAVLMPSKYSSDHSIADAEKLVQNLACKSMILPISSIAQSFEEVLKPAFNNLPSNIAEENLQARSRGVLLMAISNKLGYVLLNTSNKSETAVGYGTLYGDMCGAISVIGDCYKTLVYQLCNFINKENEVIPQNSITKPPSAELRPDQKDSDSLPDYDLLDKVLYQYIEETKSAAEIINMGYDSETVQRILNMVNNAEFKRYQTPPILRISPKAFGMGRRMPIVGKYLA
jgi:NAD+ synthase (glutamine-hydrolysing)